jgi:two-component system response regulator PilR (NtrC family)
MRKATALIVDDEPDILELVGITCMRLGVAAATAGTLREAYILLAQREFDFCLTDMRLPDGDGTTWCAPSPSAARKPRWR